MLHLRARALCGPLMLFAIAALTVGCFDRGGETRVFVDGTQVSNAGVAGPTATAAALPTSTVPALAFTPTPYSSELDPDDLTGFVFPIAGGCLPSRDEVMPNAPRPYRNGVHEGVDLYNGDICAPIGEGTDVLAMHAGVVIRADLDYTDITPAEVDALAAKTSAQGFSDPETLDVYRGRQVWIDHGNGVVTRYGHLFAITPGIGVGVDVAAGQVIGAVGESGTPESVTAPGTELHLHAEVRADGRFLGEGLAAAEARRLYERLFGASPGGAASGAEPTAEAGAAAE